MNILIVKPSSMGDIVHALPAVDLLRRQYPDAFLAWVVNDSLTGLVDLYPGVDDVIPFRRRRWGKVRHWHELMGFVGELRQHHFDLALDFQGLFRSGFITAASGASRRVGFEKAREGAPLFYTDKVAVPSNLKHAVERNIFLVRSVWDTAADARMPELLRPHECVKAGKRLLKQHGLEGHRPLLGVAPGARWVSKRWPPRFFAAVLDQVQREMPDLCCWMLGSADEKAQVQEVARHCVHCEPVDLAGATDLGTLAELLRRSHAVLTNDSGPMHLAAAAGTPVVALFGPTDPALTGPYGDGHAVFTSTCDAAPCFERQCPRDARTCSEGVSAAEVARALVDRISASMKTQNGTPVTMIEETT